MSQPQNTNQLTPAGRVQASVLLAPAEHTATMFDVIAAQAADADASRCLDPIMVAALKASPALALAASRELGGGEATVAGMGAELASVAAACASTAWCLWNHWSVFHLFCGALGPEQAPLLASIVGAHESVCFGAGAGSRVFGRIEAGGGDGDGDWVVLEGKATFASGSRYADWSGVAFAMGDGSRPPTPDELRFAILRLDDPAVRIDPTWDGAALRASATDTVSFNGVRLPLARCTPWYGANRAAAFRDPKLPMIHSRYREDWVGLSDLWLAYMAVGVVQAALAEATNDIVGRKALMGATMANFGTVQTNLGSIAAAVTTARAAVQAVAEEVDQRLSRGDIATEADFQRQGAVSSTALALCQDAMVTLLRTVGGNGLRESGTFERRWRDLAAMPIHINAHPDRIHTRLGQFLLGLETTRF